MSPGLTFTYYKNRESLAVTGLGVYLLQFRGNARLTRLFLPCTLESTAVPVKLRAHVECITLLAFIVGKCLSLESGSNGSKTNNFIYIYIRLDPSAVTTFCRIPAVAPKRGNVGQGFYKLAKTRGVLDRRQEVDQKILYLGGAPDFPWFSASFHPPRSVLVIWLSIAVVMGAVVAVLIDVGNSPPVVGIVAVDFRAAG